MENLTLSCHLNDNIRTLYRLLPIEKSFDLITRNLYIGETPGFFLGINGFCKTEILQRIFSDLQNPLFTEDAHVDDIITYVSSKIGYAQISLTDCWEDILKNVLSGPSVLFLEGFDRAILMDARSYPTRGISEPDTERVTKGARDGFVETLLFNANLIRRRVRSPRLTFSIHQIGTKSHTDVAVAYLDDCVDLDLLKQLEKRLEQLQVTSLTMGAQSLEELLLPKHFFHPLPTMLMTERPDLACSYLSEGHMLLLVDNSPSVLVLPCNIFQFLQSPEDYYKSPLVGSYFRFVRFLCIPISLFLMPVFLLLTAHYPQLAVQWQLFSTDVLTAPRVFFYVLATEFLLDLFRYSSALNSTKFSGSLSIVGGLLVGDMAINLNWASREVLFYGAITMLASLSITNLELRDALRLYRIVLIFSTGFFGLWGFLIALFLILLSVVTTPTFGQVSYFWPLCPFRGKALKSLLFRSPAFKSQPSRVWKRK